MSRSNVASLGGCSRTEGRESLSGGECEAFILAPETGIKAVELDERGLGGFIALPFRLYKGDANWVAPLISDQLKSLKGQDNKFIAESEHSFIACFRRGKMASRVMVAKNDLLSGKQGMPIATFSLVEAEDEPALRSAMAAAEDWARGRGLKRMIGPWSPTNGEDGIGLMVEGFDDPPVLLNSYNKPWYKDVLESMGYSKLADFVGYEISVERLPMESLTRGAEAAFSRAGLTASKIDMGRLEGEIKDIFSVMAEAFPLEWYNEMPTWDEFRKLAGPISRLADPDLVWIARDRASGKPVAFIVTLPDYNQVLIRMRGRLLPFGWVSYLNRKRLIKRVRLMMQYCLREYRGSSVIPALYAKIVENALANGIFKAEASVILETNIQSRRAIERIGGRLSRVYRWYSRDL